MSDMEETDLLSSALGGLLPERVEHAVGVVPRQARFEFEAEADCLVTAGDYRKREFTAGRACARAALGQAGFPRAALLPDEDGVPVWPEGGIVSISHSRGRCAAIAARRSNYRALGLDLEKTNRLSPAAAERTVHPSEQNYVQGDQKKASLLFCAKEAFFKAQFPVWRTHANFHDLELAVDESAGKLTVRKIGERFPGELRSLGGRIEFRFRYSGDFVISACWLRSGATGG
jgi:4'-phosphopantetheinyl transferase EntD